MIDKEKIASYYSNAKFLIMQDNPKEARTYVLALLNLGLDLYKQQTGILNKAKMLSFLEKWVDVSRDLYSHGVTDYVRKCFNLQPKQEIDFPEVETKITCKPIIIPTKKHSGGDVVEIDELMAISQTQGLGAAIFEKCKKSVVQLRVSSQSHSASGTGFIISKNGYLLTNAHVVFDELNNSYYKNIFMSLVGEKKHIEILVVDSDVKNDVALCEFNSNEVDNIFVLPFIKNYNSLAPGADCVIIGNAFDFGLAPFTGTIRYTKDSCGDLVHTALSNNGDSGGPVINRSGEVVGIHKSVTEMINSYKADGYGNATPSDRIQELLNKWENQHGIRL